LKGRLIIGTHHRPDFDAIASITLLKEYGPREQKEAIVTLFLRNGDEALTSIPGVTLLDRGKGEFDHHRPERRTQTTTSLVAEKLNLDVKHRKEIRRLISKVQRSDLQGESLPFDASDLIKCMQRTGVPNEEIVELGMRVIKDCLYFSEKSLERENEKVKNLIGEFLEKKEIKPPKFQEYMAKLGNPRFERPFDLVEVFGAEHQKRNEEEVKNFIWRLLEIEHKDSLNYLNAIEEVRKAWKTIVKGSVIVADVSDNPRFKDAARNELKALITIVRNTDGHTQIYFDTQKAEDSLVEALVSMVRLEECLIQKRQLPRVDLREPEWVEGIPEWYYFKAPQIPGKKKKPGRFILNGSLTAPDVPPSKIPLETLKQLTIKAIVFSPKFNWVRWKAERLAMYINKPN
jgi:hypothetical protein